METGLASLAFSRRDNSSVILKEEMPIVFLYMVVLRWSSLLEPFLLAAPPETHEKKSFGHEIIRRRELQNNVVSIVWPESISEGYSC